MITRMDAAVGRLVALLEQQGIYERTLIFFVSDNGYSASGYANNPSLDDLFHHRGPWKGEKGNISQGGLRVPALAHWPGRIRPGTESDLPWAFWDFLPTAAEVAGAAPPRTIDGVSILPTLLDEPERQQQREYLYWEFRDEQTLRLGDRYLYRPHPDCPVEVYDATRDPGQSVDLAASEPGLVARAEAALNREHTPNLYFPGPGQTREDWEAELRRRGIDLPNNVDG